MKNYYKSFAINKDTFCIDDSFGDHMYLVCGSEKAVLIDAGMGEDGLRYAAEALTELPVTLIHTHGHLDHIGADAEFKEAYLHPADGEVFREHAGEAYRRAKIGELLKEQGIPFSEEERKALFTGRGNIRLRPLSDGMVFPLGDRELRIIHTPGHTRGSVCLLDSRYGFLFGGDTVCGMGVMLSFSCSAPVSVFLDSIQRLKKQREIREIYGGHHGIPIKTEYLDKYIACGERLLRGTEGAVPEQSVFGSFFRFPYEDISLTFTEDKRR